MMRPTVAIVMSNYNHARYLRESLGGICGQTRPADEIIVIDDCSTDDSAEIITECAAGCPSVHFMRNEHRFGVQDSIARALPLVNSDYLVWTAADDRLLPGFLEKSMEALERYPHAGLCFSETTELRSNGSDRGEIVRFATEPTVSHIFDLRDLPEYMAPSDVVWRMKRTYLPIAANTVVVRRDLLLAIGGYLRQLEWHSDHFAYTVIALRYGACVVAETLALIRATPGSYSQAMRDPVRQTIVLTRMLDLLASKEYRDVRRMLRRCPSNFSPGLNLMLKAQLRKIRDWDLFFSYLMWKLRDYKRGHRLSWAGTLLRLLRRSLPYRIAGRLFPELVAERNQLAQRVGDLQAERDGAANALMDARRALQAVSAERDHLAGRCGDLEAERDGAANALIDAQRELHAVSAARDQLAGRCGDLEAERDSLARRMGDAEAQRDGLGNELERVRREMRAVDAERDGLARRIGDLEAQRDGLANELDRVRSELLGRSTADARTESIRADSLSSGRMAVERRHALETRWIPPMLVTAMPKSGTYYISRLFSEGLSIQIRIVSQQYFPDDVIRQPELRILSHGGYISQDHFGASKINLTHVSRHVDRMIVHVRDPRQALLSYVHYLDSGHFRKNEQETLLFVYPPLPDDFYRRGLASRIDWAIANWLPLLVQWVEDWAAAADRSNRPRIRFTRYEDLVADWDKFVSEVLDFFEIPHEHFTSPDIAPDRQIHFRKGKIDEWVQVFSPAQVAAANARIPGALASRFGWPMGKV